MRRTIAAALIASLILMPAAAMGKEGKLRKFEKELDKPPPERHVDPGQSDYDDSYDSTSSASAARGITGASGRGSG